MSQNKNQGDIDMTDLASALPNTAGFVPELVHLWIIEWVILFRRLVQQASELGGPTRRRYGNIVSNVKKRVEVLREIQSQYDDFEAKFYEERAALEAKYQKLYEPSRYEIVNGLVEVEGVVDEPADLTAEDKKLKKVLTKTYHMIDEDEPILEKAIGLNSYRELMEQDYDIGSTIRTRLFHMLCHGILEAVQDDEIEDVGEDDEDGDDEEEDENEEDDDEDEDDEDEEEEAKTGKKPAAGREKAGEAQQVDRPQNASNSDFFSREFMTVLLSQECLIVCFGGAFVSPVLMCVSVPKLRFCNGCYFA
ncbi:hypothetical protein HPP92_002814 [Vanilla planifolia]|uniref:Uncharacterized protein n=1 Tax=Vanilla planifolia TaxID=51239 RepID=A0A835S673_VANPL|nr:hypothetical protein HPP92_002814 [Vanilla planifolia]